MFDTLDTILSFIVIIFILSLIAQSLQSIMKRLLNSKTKKTIDGLMEILKFSSAVVKSSEMKKVLKQIQSKYKNLELSSENIRRMLEEMENRDELKQTLAAVNFTQIKSAVIDRLDSEVKGLQERYVSHMRQISVALAILLSVVLNADSLEMIEKISSDKAVRQVMVNSDYIQKEMAKRMVTTGSQTEDGAVADELRTISDLASEYQGLNLGIKWSVTAKEFSGIKGNRPTAVFLIKKVIGILITAILISMGAPFWHDMLKLLFGLKDRVKTNGG